MAHPSHPDDGRPAFDLALAAELVGKHVLVGLTIKDLRGGLVSRTQFHGRVVSADARDGVRLALEGQRTGEYLLPPDTGAFRRAEPGTYTLRETGEQVEDPDFTCSWTLEQPDA